MVICFGITGFTGKRKHAKYEISEETGSSRGSRMSVGIPDGRYLSNSPCLWRSALNNEMNDAISGELRSESCKL